MSAAVNDPLSRLIYDTVRQAIADEGRETLREWRTLWRSNPEVYRDSIDLEDKTGHTFRSPSRDTQPASLRALAEKFAAGYIPRGDTDQVSMLPSSGSAECVAYDDYCKNCCKSEATE